MKKNSINRVIGFVIVGLVLLAAVIETGRSVYTWSQQAAKQPRYTIVIDPGHGGNDPGKIGINDVPEKDVNLAISLELKEILEQNDCRVVMTRQKDEALYQAGDTNKKVADLRARCQISFTAESSRGAQVFYRASSQEGKKLADILQTQLVSGLDPDNRRVAKANSDYFMLKNTTATMVIVECGFLSNSKEAELLTQASYQRRVAWAVALGVLQYVSGGLS